jgi:type IV pilus assembly protein PilK
MVAVMKKNEVSWAHSPAPEMGEAMFAQWQALLDARVGMQIEPARKVFLQTHLHLRMREIGCTDYADYYQRIIDGPHGAVEWTILVDHLTVQETSFFRHSDSYQLVRKYLRENFSKPTRRAVEFWSVGCSSGEEAYSLAILAEEELSKRGFYYGVTGTDVSLSVLSKAKKAVYSERKLSGLTEEQKKSYFIKQENHTYTIKQSLKDRVCFAQLNVLNLNQAPMHGMDVIFCQNMLIYFRRWRRKDIVNRLVERLAPGGLLVLGLGEVTDWKHSELERVDDKKTLAFIRRTDG